MKKNNKNMKAFAERKKKLKNEYKEKELTRNNIKK